MRDEEGSFLHPNDRGRGFDEYVRVLRRASVASDEVTQSANEVALNVAEQIRLQNGFELDSREHSALVEAALRGISIFASGDEIHYPTSSPADGLAPWQILKRSEDDEARMNKQGENDE